MWEPSGDVRAQHSSNLHWWLCVYVCACSTAQLVGEMQSVILIVRVSGFFSGNCGLRWEQASPSRGAAGCEASVSPLKRLIFHFSSQKERKHTFHMFCAHNLIKTSICSPKKKKPQNITDQYLVSCLIIYTIFLSYPSLRFHWFLTYGKLLLTTGYFLRFLRNCFKAILPSRIHWGHSTLRYTKVPQSYVSLVLYGRQGGFLQRPDSVDVIFHLP